MKRTLDKYIIETIGSSWSHWNNVLATSDNEVEETTSVEDTVLFEGIEWSDQGICLLSCGHNFE